MLSLVSCGGVTRPSGNRGLARVPLPDLAGSLLPEPPAPERSRPRPPSLGRCLQGCGPPGSPLPHALCGNPSFMEGTRDAPVLCLPFYFLVQWMRWYRKHSWLRWGFKSRCDLSDQQLFGLPGQCLILRCSVLLIFTLNSEIYSIRCPFH